MYHRLLLKFLLAVALTASLFSQVPLDRLDAASCKPRRSCTSTTTSTTTTSTTTPPPASSPPVSATAVDSWTVKLTWTAPAGAASTEVLRDGRLIDRFPVAAGSVYTDGLLWPASPYRYVVRFVDTALNPVGELGVDVATPAQSAAFPRPYASTSFWNVPIAADVPTAPGSAAMVEKGLVAYRTGANFANSHKWGIALTYADAVSRNYPVACTLYDCNTQVSARIPAHAVPTTGSDQHLAVVDRSTGTELDMYKSVHDLATDTWSAGSRYVTSASGVGAMCEPGTRCNGANAAGFALLGGVIRPEEIAQGRIDHALVFTTPFTRKGVIACPATHTDGKFDDVDALPEGARIQLDPAFDVEAQAWPAWKKVVARALQTYGAYLGDTGGSVAIRGESTVNRGYDAWARAGATSSGLGDLPWERFRVLDYAVC